MRRRKKVKSNADLVKEIAREAKAIGTKVVSPEKARKLMGMKGKEGQLGYQGIG